jgi:hypothetical protein
MMKDRIIELIFIQEAIATMHSYLGILEQCSAPQLPCDAWFQQDGAPPHFGNIVRQFSNERFPNMWIGISDFFGPQDHRT